MSKTDQIREALVAAFEPQSLEIFDESELHRGHAGYQEGGESHFRVVIRSAVFSGMTRVARHRAVHKALGADLLDQIHALALDISE